MTIKSLSGLAMGAFVCVAMALPMGSNTAELAGLNEDATTVEQDMLSAQHNYELADFDDSVGKIVVKKIIIKD